MSFAPTLEDDVKFSPESTLAGTSAPADISLLIPDLNINEHTYLATDYLNHFGELIMLVELLPDMPDMVGEILDWRPKSYEQHFHDSGFEQSEVYILAYEQCPPKHREAFDGAVADLNSAIVTSQEPLSAAAAKDDAEELRVFTQDLVAELQTLSSMIASIINCDDQGNQQAAIDALFA